MTFVSFHAIVGRVLRVGVWLGALAAVPQVFAVSPQQLVEIADFSSPVVSPAGAHVARAIGVAGIVTGTLLIARAVGSG